MLRSAWILARIASSRVIAFGSNWPMIGDGCLGLTSQSGWSSDTVIRREHTKRVGLRTPARAISSGAATWISSPVLAAVSAEVP
jgi:hypothetical protein